MKNLSILLLATFLVITACETAKIVDKKEKKISENSILFKNKWVLTEDGNSVKNFEGKEIYVQFAPETDGFKIFGNTGCNSINGNLELTGSTFRVKELLSTKKYCPNMQQETSVQQLLKKADRWVILGENLSLYQGKIELLTFRLVKD